jgi:hypothetical protein
MLEITYAFVGYIMGSLALLISLYVWLTVDELIKNGRSWVQLNQELKKKIERLEREKQVPPSPWKQ